jgi:hypothetical protein
MSETHEHHEIRIFAPSEEAARAVHEALAGYIFTPEGVETKISGGPTDDGFFVEFAPAKPSVSGARAVAAAHPNCTISARTVTHGERFEDVVSFTAHGTDVYFETRSGFTGALALMELDNENEFLA